MFVSLRFFTNLTNWFGSGGCTLCFLRQFYSLLTGFYPFPESDGDRAKRLVKRGEQAFIDPRFSERSLGEKALAEIIPRCWVYAPDHRITIFELVELLRHAVDLDRQQKSA